MQISGKTVVITGGGRGIGRELAKAFAAKGGRIAAFDLNQADLDETVAQCKAQGVEARGYVANVTDEQAVIAAMDAIVADLGSVDVLINNAGIGFFGPVDEVSWSDFETIFHTNVFGAALIGREAARRMKAQNKGNIINIASSAGVRGFKNGTVYAASKFAVRGMTECWRDELRPFNIRVMLVNPSAVPTAFNVENREEKPLKDNMLRPEELAHAMVSALAMDDRGFIPELGVWATNPF